LSSQAAPSIRDGGLVSRTPVPLIVELISCLLARYAETQVEMRDKHVEPLAVRRALAFLDENLADKVTLDALAAAAELTPFRLLRSFRRAIGI
jgi:transcriptional regulator GlxA family with amidase domain